MRYPPLSLSKVTLTATITHSYPHQQFSYSAVTQSSEHMLGKSRARSQCPREPIEPIMRPYGIHPEPCPVCELPRKLMLICITQWEVFRTCSKTLYMLKQISVDLCGSQADWAGLYQMSNSLLKGFHGFTWTFQPKSTKSQGLTRQMHRPSCIT